MPDQTRQADVMRLNAEGEALYRSDKPEEAYHHFQTAHGIDCNDAETLNNLGVACLARERPEEALDWFTRGLEQDPQHRELAANASRLLEALSDNHRVESAQMRTRPIAGEKTPATELTWPPLTHDPLVSVIIPTHDRSELLGDALESLARQTYENWEALIVNDGGKDPSKTLDINDRRIRVLQHRFSLGRSAARNTALRMARGEIVSYLDQDDTYLNNHLATVVDSLRGQDTAFVYTDAMQLQEVLQEGQRTILYSNALHPHQEFSRNQLLVSNYVHISTWSHRFECIRHWGFFDEDLDGLEDWEFLLRLSAHVRPLHIGCATVEVHTHLDSPDNVSHLELRQTVSIYEHLCRRYPVNDALLVTARDNELEQLRRRQQAAELSRSDADPALLYQYWCDKHALTEVDAQFMALRMTTQWTAHPEFELFTMGQEMTDSSLQLTWKSLRAQLYKEWRWTIVSDRSRPRWIKQAKGQIHWLRCEVGGTSSGPNKAINLRSADWVGWIAAGDQLAPHALFKCAEYANLHGDWQLIYTDEDIIEGDGCRRDPSFKPDFNVDLLRSQPYLGGLMLLKQSVLNTLGGIDRADRATLYDLALRVLDSSDQSKIGHVPAVLYHQSSENSANSTPDADQIVRLALQNHFLRNAIRAKVGPGLSPHTYFVEYDHNGDTPLVSIIVPTRNAIDLLQPCIDSVLSKTKYPKFEILIVDNGSDDPNTLRYLRRLEKQERRVRVIEYPEPFNFSVMSNRAANQARGEYLLFLNNDTQVVQENWLERMLNHGLRKEIGVVGARLVFPDCRVQHVGVWTGMYDVADHPLLGLPMDEPGPLNRAHCVQNYSAVTAACMLVRTSVYKEIGGMDELDLPIMFNDVDLCLRIRKLGYGVVFTPFATLVHRGSSSVSQCEKRRQWIRAGKAVMLDRWLPELAADPAGNRNLSLTANRWHVEIRTDVPWDPLVARHPRILAYPFNRWGTGYYRVRSPLKALEEAGMIQHALMPAHNAGRVLGVCELLRAAPDAVLMQNMLHDHHLRHIELYRRHCQAFLVFGQDDMLTDIPGENPYSKTVYPDVASRLRRALASCDRLIVSTQPLAEEFRSMIDDVVVVPNRLSRARWSGLQSRRRVGPKPRVGWAGAQQHQGDLAILIDVIKRTEQEVDWIFLGMCPQEIRSHCREFHQGVPISQYPEKLASLNLDLAVAPLALNRFNECKSNLRILEYGILGWPVVCSDIEPFRDAPVCRVSNTNETWIRAIREHVHDLDHCARRGEKLRAWVEADWILEDRVSNWMQALLPDSAGKSGHLDPSSQHPITTTAPATA